MAFSIPRMRERFEAQFEATDDGGFLYRRNGKAEPIPVTAWERERFTSEYVISLYFILSTMVLALMAVLAFLIWRSGNGAMGQVPPAQILAGMVVISMLGAALMAWAAGAPARALQGRSSAGPERSRDEIRAFYFKRLSYGRIGAIGLIGLAAPLARRNLWPEAVGWHRASWVVGLFVTLAAGVTAFRKWRFESRHSEHSQA